MYCQLCQMAVSATHDSSSGHRSARELVASALDRLTNHLEASGDSGGFTTVPADAEKTSVGTPEAVSFCDTCNTVYPINEQSAHYRERKHGLALLSEQEFEELVHAYIGGEPKETSEASDDVALVDETEAVNTYTCQLCALEVPRVFRAEHERGSRHRANRMFALVAARRARDVFAPIDSSGDGSGDKPKFSGKMMKRLLKAYTGRSDEVDNTEEPKLESELDSTKPEPKLTPKEYFTDILPFLPYVGTLNILYIDDSKFVTIKIGNETLKIHVNNLNGLYNIDGKDGYYMSCKLCDGSSNIYYGSMDQQDKCHVMSLGHIRNVMSPVDNVHLIRKVDDMHYICGLCNVHIYPNLYAYAVENHIFKDARHSVALTEALERGKDFKETKDHMKIMIYTPPVPKSSNFKTNQGNNQKWTFGIPQQPRHYSGLFGTQTSGIGTAQNTGFSTQAQSFGSNQTTFGSAGPQNVGFGSGLNTGFGNATNTVFGNAGAQNTTFGSVSAPNSGFGSNSSQNSGFGNASIQNTGFGSAQSKGSLFGSTQSRNNTGSFGVAQNNPTGFGALQNNATGLCTVQNNASIFGASSNSASASGASPNNATGFGTVQNNATSLGAAQNNTTGVGPGPDKATGLGAAQTNATCFGVSQNVLGGNQNNTSGVAAVQNNGTNFGVTQNKATGFSPTKNEPSGFGATHNNANSVAVQNAGFSFGNTQNDFSSAEKQNESDKNNIAKVQSPNSVIFKTAQPVSPFNIKFVADKKPEAVGDSQNNQSKYDRVIIQRPKEPSRRLIYSSSSSGSD